MSSLTGNQPITLVSGNQAWRVNKFITSVLGPSQISYQRFPSQSNSTQNQIYQVQVPSLNAGACRDPLYHWIGGFRVTGTTLQPQYVKVGLSESAVDQIISNETINIGTRSNAVQRSLVGVELNRLNMDSIDRTIYSSGNSTSYNDFAVNFSPWINSNRNPLAAYFDVPLSDSCPQPRTTDCRIIATDNATYIDYAFEIFFTSAVSPFNGIMNHAKPSIRNLTNLQFQLNFESNLARFVSVVNTNVGNTVLTGITNFTFTQCEMLLTFITPAIEALEHLSEDADLYEYAEIQPWFTPVQVPPVTTNPSAKQQITFNLQQITASVIPSKLIIFCKPATALYNGIDASRSPNYYLPVANNGFQLQFNNTQVLNNMTQFDIWRMSVENGLRDCTFEQFIGRDVTINQIGAFADISSYVLGGNIIIIDPAKDLLIGSQGLTNGTLANWSLQGNITFLNQSYNAAPPAMQMGVIAIYPGYLVSNGQVQANTGLLTIQETMESFKNPHIASTRMTKSEHHADSGSYEGGGFFSNLFKKVKSVVGKVANFAHQHKDIINQGIDIGKQYLGSGYATDTSQQAIQKKTLSKSYKM